MAKKTIQSDTLAVHYPYDRFRDRRNGKHPGKTFGPTKAQDKFFDVGSQKWSAIEPLTVSGIDELHAALAALAVNGKAFITRSARAGGAEACYRCTEKQKGTDPAGVKAVALHTLAIDADNWPNVLGFDPRTQKAEAFRWMLSLMGKEISKTTVSAFWSSSCCVRSVVEPATLSARFWIWMDEAMTPEQAVELLKRLDIRVKAFFRAIHDDPTDTSTYQNPELAFNDPTQTLVDWRCGLVSQRIYVASPRFLPGIEDPLPPGGRHMLLVGFQENLKAAACLKVATCLKELPTLDTRKPKGVKSVRKPSARRLTKARSLEWNVPGQVVPLAAAGREIAAMRAANQAAATGTAKDHREACDILFQERVSQEMVALAARRGGLSEGNRNNSSLMIASAVFAAAPLTNTVAQCQFQVRALLLLVVDADWIVNEWEGKGDSGIVACFLAAQRGEKGLNGWDPRYTFFRKSLLAYWQPTPAEVDELGLMSLLSEAQRSQARRNKAKADKVETPAQAARRVKAAEAYRLRESGLSFSKIVAKMGVPITTVQRLLKAAPAVQIAVVEAGAVPTIQTAAAAEMTAPVAETTITQPQGEPTMARHNADDINDAQLDRYHDQVVLEMFEDARIAKAFNRWFATTDEGKEEGRWDNVVYWQWQAAGSPAKIDLYQHPSRPGLLAKFRTEWLEHKAIGTPMSMTVASAPARAQFGRRAV